MADYTGVNIGKYHIVKLLGMGGMAYVYEAIDTSMDRSVAIKFIRKDAFPPEKWDILYARFDREIKILAKLDNQNIIHIYETGIFDETPYYVMEYINGGTLKQRMLRKFSPAEAAEILCVIADALESAHQKHILHRDVTPSNIMFRKNGSPVLTDFGIAKLLNSEKSKGLTSAGFSVGTVEYASPEQCLGKKLDGRTDEYSLGIIFYEMITGEKPFSGSSTNETMIRQVKDPLPEPENVPENVRKVLFKALAKDPDQRYPTIGEFGKELKKLAFAQPPKHVIESDPNAETIETPIPPAIQESDPIKEEPVAAQNQNQGKTKKRTVFTAGMIFLLLISACGLFLYSRRNIPLPEGTEVTAIPTETIPETNEVEETEALPGSPAPENDDTKISETETIFPYSEIEPVEDPAALPEEELPETGYVIDGCAMKTYLRPGDQAAVTSQRGLRLRETPGGNPTGVQASGENITIEDGPVCANGIVWLKVNYIGHHGWCMEGENGDYYLSKVKMTPTVPVSCRYPTHLEIGSSAEVINITGLKMYNEPEGSLLETQAFPGKPLEIIDGPQCRNGALWWKVSFLGYSGWVTEVLAEGKYYLEPR